MKHVVYEDFAQCQCVWEQLWPVKGIFDLWQVRSCFHDAYLTPLQFHTIEQGGKPVGFLPLSWNEEMGQFVLFPGETWHGKTWIEQNRIIAKNSEVFQTLLDFVPGSMHLRYLIWSPFLDSLKLSHQDEIGYLFYPRMYDFSFDNYWCGFSGKTRKKIKANLKKFESQKIDFRFNHVKDLEQMFALNLEAFSNESYFSDTKFYNSFERLASYFWDMGLLRIVTVLIGGRIAAVDMGGVFNNTYTLFAGGTSSEFIGVAKLINLHHMEWACHKRFDSVDFLCGDFNWKKRFHLTPRALYEISINKQISLFEWNSNERETACA